ncbi:SUKH-3 domain-containing protein [Streptomyces lydicus]|uniref:SUKH-3 domain-containing protein n=1 Tax=Streptomyces lydicus TaxID=47763 RepID=UPI0013E94D47|nr:SUKH-3 domain-containing protein [Streptomyces lydicus]MCZ1008952.1 SUKH-3 domain-containing protein [Streptomyces lydicus]
MPSDAVLNQVDHFLAEAGWYPGRDEADRVAALTQFVISDLAAHGCAVSLFPAAESFLRSYGFLDVTFPYSPGRTEHFNTCARYCAGEAEEITELSEELQRPVFPVGWDKIEGGLAVIDPAERMFCIHHTGFSYMGVGIREAIAALYVGGLQHDVLTAPSS